MRFGITIKAAWCDVIFFGEVASHAHFACHALAAAMRAVHGKAMDGMALATA